MINYIYQLVSPKKISIKYEDMKTSGKVIVKPAYMSVCKADMRYFFGERNSSVLKEKLPMALIHECAGTVVKDDTGSYKNGQQVILIPNKPIEKSNVIYENYRRGSAFLSSGYDGFMRELVDIDADRVIPFDNIPITVAATCEFLSVCVHSVQRFLKHSHEIREKIGIWGDGSLAYYTAAALKELCPDSRITVVGKQENKLSRFSFVDEVYLAQRLPEKFQIDHAFECCGGEGSYFAISDIIKYINPQGTVMLMGVTENEVPILTRDVLEKGLVIVGASRSGRADFEKAVSLMEDEHISNRLSTIIEISPAVSSAEDILRVFNEDSANPFKTVFAWNL